MPVFLIILTLFIVADGGVWLGSALRLRRHHAAKWLRRSMHTFFATQLGCALVMLVLPLLLGHSGRRLEWLPVPVQAVVYIWHIIALPLTVLSWIVFDVVRFVVRIVQRLRQWLQRKRQSSSQPTETDEVVISRRSVLASALTLAPPLLTLGAAGYSLAEEGSFRIARRTLRLAGLPAAFDGYRIAQVSDLHVGRWSSDAFLHDVIRQTNALDADVILFTGDLIDISVSDLPRSIELMRQLRARNGLYMIEGNHDLIDDPAEFHLRIRQSQLRFLWDDSATLYAGAGDKLQLLGLPWSRSDVRMSQMVGEIGRLRDPHAFPILLAHHPHAFDAATASGFPLVLSGHTHGGQLAVGPLNAGSLFFRYLSGLYRKGPSQLFISNGTGNWFPLRINAPAEIVELTLRVG